MKVRFLFFSALVVFFFSCRSVPKDVAYLQDFDRYMQTVHPEVFSTYDAIIKPNDQLTISVASPILDQMQVAQFNLPANTVLTPGETSIMQSPVLQTYTVNPQGEIHFPILGKIQLAGLTRSQAVDLIAQKVSAYLPNPIINLQIISYKVTVLGEVFKPGTVEVPDGRVSIFDALGAVGDLTIHGDRRNVLLIRDNKSIYKFDLTSTDIFNSPYYYLQQNDVIYVEPDDVRKMESQFGVGDNYRLSIVSMSLSTLSVIASTIIAIVSLSRKP